MFPPFLGFYQELEHIYLPPVKRYRMPSTHQTPAHDPPSPGISVQALR